MASLLDYHAVLAAICSSLFARLAVNYIYVSLQTIAVAVHCHAWLLWKINLDINYLTFVLLAV